MAFRASMDSRLKSRLPRAHSSFCSARIMVMSLRTASARVISAPFIGGHRPSADEDVRSPCSFSSAHRWPSPVGGRGRPQSMLFQFRSSVAIARRRTRTSAVHTLSVPLIGGHRPSADEDVRIPGACKRDHRWQRPVGGRGAHSPGDFSPAHLWSRPVGGRGRPRSGPFHLHIAACGRSDNVGFQ
jgi:hypothetical protein